MKIISHSADADGLVSAYLVAKKFGITDPKDFIMLDYGCGIDFLPLISNNEEVVICDFSFENGPYDMHKLLAKTKNVTWIDHHKSSLDLINSEEIESIKCNSNFLYFINTEYCATVLCYVFAKYIISNAKLNVNSININKSAPRRMLSRGRLF